MSDVSRILASGGKIPLQKMRVHELAKASGLTSKEVLVELAKTGEYVKSAASVVEGPVARRFLDAHLAASSRTPQGPHSGEKFGPRPSSPPRLDPFKRAIRKADAASHERTWEEVVLAQAIKAAKEPVPDFELDLDLITDTLLHKRFTIAEFGEPIRRGELERAQQAAQTWEDVKLVASEPLDDPIICEWIGLDRRVEPQLAVEAIRSGLTPRQLELRLWYGRNTVDHPRMIDRVLSGEKSMEDAAHEIRSHLSNREVAQLDRRDHD